MRSNLALNLSEGEGKQVVLVSTSDDTLIRGRRYDMLTIRGHPSDKATLRAAGAASASELWACTSEGTVNAAIALRAREEVHQDANRPPLAVYAMVRGTDTRVSTR